MAKKKILDEIVRYHRTDPARFASIKKKGLIPQVGLHQIEVPDEYQTNGVFTGTTPWFEDEWGKSPLVIRIPREKYNLMKRLEYNPEVGPENADEMITGEVPGVPEEFAYSLQNRRRAQTYNRGGQTDVFLEAIPSEYIEFPENWEEDYFRAANEVWDEEGMKKSDLWFPEYFPKR